VPRLAARVTERTELVKRIMDGAFDPSAARLYEAVYDILKDESLKVWCYRGLKAVDRVQWDKDLRVDGDLTYLIRQLGSPNADDALGEEYRLALLDCGVKILEGQRDPKFPALWPPLLAALSSADRKQLRQSLWIKLEATKGSIPAKFFDIFGDELADPILLNNQPQIFSGLFTPLVKNNNFRAVRWIADVLPKLDIQHLTPNTLQALTALRAEVKSLLDERATKNPSSEEHKEEQKAAKALMDALNELLKDRGPPSGLLIQQ
jgi:hypothetical protein